MIIRQLTPEDQSQFFKVEEDTFTGDEMSENSFLHSCENDNFVGLFVNDHLAGYLLLKPGKDYSHLNRIAVHSDYRGQGLGSKLMEHALEVFHSHNCRTVGLYVETKNQVAISLYQKYGFEIKYESWHYILPQDVFEKHKEISHGDARIRELYIADLVEILTTFPDLKEDLLVDWMAKPGPNIFLGVFDPDLKLFARFNSDFSGCFPFKISDISYVDLFVDYLIQTYKRKDRDYIRLTFDRYQDLAHRFNTIGYTQHHHLYKMERLLK